MRTEFDKARARLLAEIEQNARETEMWTGRRAFSDRVMAAMAETPRHEFVMADDAPYAYINRPRAIGFGQTISQPYIVALMSDLLDLSPSDRVLEIGAGSGYQAAVLAGLCAHVFTLEVVDDLATSAAHKLEALGYANITIRHGDGFAGWPNEAPFDAIIVTAAPEQIPQILVEQLKPGGRMVIPVGRPHDTQSLCLCKKDENGRTKVENLLPVAFVPMVNMTTR
ncbi:MAG: protein-L-isoaspartate(D-aspartate) O-methyltransferase [Rhodospirillales bacterium]|jgi:protein-L-isoaspartate(D-aspartate) O-methyltransferase|nr:protein-L-isoaspartate(D-aspartate) O-methyltransferase [Rhodospirillales bacterium]